MNAKSRYIKIGLCRIEKSFLKTVIVLIAVLYLLNELILKPYNYFSMDKIEVQFITFGAAAFILYLVLYDRLLGKLYSTDTLQRISFFVFAVGLLAIGFFLLRYLDITGERLVNVDTPNEILYHRNADYFSVRNYRLDNNLVSVYPEITSSRKGNDLYVADYFVIPFVNEKTSAVNSNIWMGIKFNSTVSNRLIDKNNVDTMIGKAHKSNIDKFNGFDYRQIKYFSNTHYLNDLNLFKKAVIKIHSADKLDSVMVITPHVNSFESDRFNYLLYLILCFLVVNGVILFVNYVLLSY